MNILWRASGPTPRTPAAFRLAVGIVMVILLAGCSVFSGSTPTPLPTVVLGANSSTQPSPPVPNTTSAPNISSGGGGGVTASGNVAPAQQAQIGSITGGTIAQLNVAVGDKVQSGQVLVKLAGSEKWTAAVDAANVELLSAQQDLKTLNTNADQARSAAQLRLANAQKALDDAQRVRSYRNYRNGSESSIEAAQADVILAADRLKTAEDNYSGVASASDTDVNRAAALSALAAARQAHDKAVANLNYLLALPKTVDVNQAEAQLQSAQAEVQNAQAAYDKLKNGPDPDALTLIQARIQNAQAQILASQSALNDLALKAPFASTVAKVNFQSGELVAPGQPVIVLVDLDHLQVKTTDLSERDIPNVKPGQVVTVNIKALNQEVKGRVAQISPLADTLGGDVVYGTTIDLDTQPPGIMAGMSVEVQY